MNTAVKVGDAVVLVLANRNFRNALVLHVLAIPVSRDAPTRPRLNLATVEPPGVIAFIEDVMHRDDADALAPYWRLPTEHVGTGEVDA